jgi:hypothetical protein
VSAADELLRTVFELEAAGRLSRTEADGYRRVIRPSDQERPAVREQLKEYAQHKLSCPLSTTYRWARIHHFENHDGSMDWAAPACGDTACVAWAKVGETGRPDCTCGLEALLAALQAHPPAVPEQGKRTHGCACDFGYAGGHEPTCQHSHLYRSQAHSPAVSVAEPTDRPIDSTGRDRLMLNAYGRECWEAGWKAATSPESSNG